MQNEINRFEVLENYRVNNDPGICCAEVVFVLCRDVKGRNLENRILLKVHYLHKDSSSKESMQEGVLIELRNLLAQAAHHVGTGALSTLFVANAEKNGEKAFRF